MRALSTRDRRALAALAAGIVIYVVVAYGVFPAYDRFAATRDNVSKQEDQLRKYRRALSRKDQYTQLTQRANASLQVQQARFFPVSSGSADLQSIVEASAESAGLVLAQRNVVAGRKRDALVSEISMSLTSEATLAQLLSFLNSLRQSPKFLSVTTSQIAPLQVFRELPQNTDFKKTLRVNLTVVGLVINSDVAPVR